MTPQTMAGGFAGIGMLSSLFGGVSAYKTGKAEQESYDYNAQVTLQNMRSQMVASQQRYSTLIGKQAAAYAASGVDVTSGSPLLVMAATARSGGLQAEEIKQAGTEEANLQQYYGKLAAWKGKMTGISDFLSGMSTNLAEYGIATDAFSPKVPQRVPAL